MLLHEKSIKDCVTIAFKNQYLAYAYFKKTNNYMPYMMSDYAIIPCTNMELEKQFIFNPTYVSKQLCALLNKNVQPHTEIRISLEGAAIFEKILSHDKFLEETHTMQLEKLLWFDLPLFNNYIYICSISRELLFQYQLLAIQNKFNMRCITTSNMALLNSACLFAKDIKDKQCSHIEDIAALIPTQEIAKLYPHVPPPDSPLLIAELIGLCTAELTYENN